MDRNNDFKRGWLSGIFDGEGTIHFKHPGHSKKNHGVGYHLSVTNTDEKLIRICYEYLTELGIHFRVYPRKKLQNPTWKPIWTITITRGNDFIKFREMIGFQSPKKIERLDLAVSWITRPKTKYDIELIKKMYWEEGLSYRQIAKRFGLKQSTGIKQLFDRWSIPRRDRESATSDANKMRYHKYFPETHFRVS